MIPSLRNWKDTLKASCLNLIYPPLCLHCEGPLSSEYKVLCAACFAALSFIDSEEYCKRCFRPKEGVHCLFCAKKSSPFYRLVCPLECTGPAFTLQSKLHAFNTSFIAKGLAAFMVHRFIQQDMPWPDCIVPMPCSFMKNLFQGSPALLLSYAASEMLQVPLLSSLKIADKKVLLIGEQLNAPFFAAGESLIAGCPHSILGAAVFNGVYQ